MMLIKKKEKQTNKNKETAHLSTIHLWYHGSFLAIGYHTFLLTEPPYSRLFFPCMFLCIQFQLPKTEHYSS